MSLRAFLRSRIDVYRLDGADADTGKFGEPSKTPKLLHSRVRGLVQAFRTQLGRDGGSGDRATGVSSLAIELKAEPKQSDILHIVGGDNKDTWWIVEGLPLQPPRGKHYVGFVKAYVGNRPNA